MLRRPLTRLLVLGALIGSGAASAQELTLRFQPEAGTTLEVLQVIEQNTSMDMGPMGSQTMRSDIRMESTQTVLDATDAGARRVEFVFDRMAMSMKSGDIEMLSLDTDRQEEAADPSMAAFGAMVGRAYIVEIDELGGLVGTEGLAELLEQVMASAGNPQVQEVLEQAFSEDSMMQTMQMSMPVFPKEALGVGDAWSRDFAMTMAAFGTIEVEATYTVEGLSEFAGEPCVRLGAEMSMEFDFNAPMLEQLAAAAGSEADVRMDADDVSASGWMCIARSDGVTLESEVENQFTMRIAIATAGQEAMELQMVLDQVTRQTVERQ